MKKSVALWILCIAVSFFVSGCVVAVSPEPQPVAVAPVYGPPPPEAQVEVGAPPPLEISDPTLVVVPSGDAYVYMIPNVAGVYFYEGFWYRTYGGAWFRAGMYNGPWIGIAGAPGVVIGVDPFYPFYLPAGYFTIGWWDFHHHWRDWGHRRHWHSHHHFRNEMRRDVRQHRLNQIRSDRLKGIDRSRGTFKSGKTFKSTTFKSTGSYKGTTFKRTSTFKGTTFKRTGAVKSFQKSNIKAAPKSAPKSAPKAHSGHHK